MLGACASTPAALRPLGPPRPDGDLDGEAREWIDRTLRDLTLEEKAAQLTATWIPGAYTAIDSEDFEELARLVDLGIGGFTISIGPPHAYAAKLNALQARAEVPLLITADFESGGPGMRLNGMWALPSMLDVGGGTQLPPTMGLGAIGEERFARGAGRITAAEARAVGVHLTFAPVLDVNSDPDNPIINTRSFGEDPADVGRLAAAFIRGAREGGLLTTGKHFPGHGDTDVDSHIALPVIAADRERLDRVELPPFRDAVAAGVDAIMTAHIALPGVLGPDAPPATLSPYFLTGVLREEMGFRGPIYTDAMTMGGIRERYGAEEAAVRALEAGADVVLSPPDPEAAIAAIAAAAREGRLPEDRLDASVRRVLELKARAGLHRGRQVDLAAVDTVVGSRAHRAFADTAAARALVLVRDGAGRVPLEGADRRVLSLTYAREANLPAGLTFDATLGGGVETLDRARVGPGTGAATYDSLAARADSADLLLASLYVPPRSGAGDVDVSPSMVCFLERVRRAGIPVAVLSFGNPYLLSRLPWAETYLLAWDGSATMQRAAARGMLGEAPISGRLPISLPTWHEPGDGLRRPGPPAPVGGLTGAAPTELGLAAEGIEAAARRIRTAVRDSVTPGAALAVGRSGGGTLLGAWGRLDHDPASAPGSDSTVYDLASLTKPLGTATALLLLAADGRLSLDDRVGRWLEEWREGWRGEVTIRTLLLHRGGLPPWRPWWREIEGRAAYREAIAALEPAYPPGDSTVYSDPGFMTLGFVAEAAAGEPLDRYLERELFRPLGLRETGFRPPASLHGRVAPTEVDTAMGRGHVRGEVHDENAFALGGVAGHAGLFSSARDLAVLARAWLRAARGASCGSDRPGGVASRDSAAGGAPARRAGARPERSGAARARSAEDPDRPLAAEDPGGPLAAVPDSLLCPFLRPADATASRALGWETPAPGSSAGDRLSPRAFGHTGFTGTSVWIDPELDLFVVLLTNRVNPSREERGHVPLRRAVHDAMAGAAAAPSARPRAAAAACGDAGVGEGGPG